jgi:YD repeat-containing protein
MYTTSKNNNDRFGLVIGYDQVGHIGSAQGAQAQYNGNIGWLMYAMHGVSFSSPEGATQLIGYSFGYDMANRLLKGDFGYNANGAWRQIDAYDEKDITYHKNGNITALKRYDQNGSLMHNYSYTYYPNTNRLRRVTGSGDRYVYDSNGNVRHDLDNNIGFVIYDIFNLPVTVYTTAGAQHLYYYNHNGNRVRKHVGGSSEYFINGVDGRTEVVTNVNGSWATYNLYGLDQIGQIRRSGSTWNRFYFLKDHLGSVRVTVNASGNVVSYDDYYPFACPPKPLFGAGGGR